MTASPSSIRRRRECLCPWAPARRPAEPSALPSVFVILFLCCKALLFHFCLAVVATFFGLGSQPARRWRGHVNIIIDGVISEIQSRSHIMQSVSRAGGGGALERGGTSSAAGTVEPAWCAVIFYEIRTAAWRSRSSGLLRLEEHAERFAAWSLAQQNVAILVDVIRGWGSTRPFDGTNPRQNLRRLHSQHSLVTACSFSTPGTLQHGLRTTRPQPDVSDLTAACAAVRRAR